MKKYSPSTIYWFFTSLLIISFTSLTQAQKTIADEHLEKGMEYYYYDLPDSALYHLEIADSLYEDLMIWPKQMKCKVGIVRIIIGDQQFPKSIQLIEAGIAYGEKKLGKNNASIGLLYSYKGVVDFILQRELEPALEQINTSLEILKRANALQEEEWICHSHRAFIYYHAGKTSLSKKAAEESLKKIAHSSQKEKAIAGSVHNLLGSLYRKEGNYQKAVYHYREAISDFDRFENSQTKYSLERKKSYPLHNLGNIYYEIGQYEKSEEYLKKALAIFQRTKPSGHISIGTSYFSIGNVLRLQYKFDLALKQYDKAAKIIALYPHDELSFGAVLHNEGLCYSSLKQFDTALIHLQKALRLRRGIPNIDSNLIAETLLGIGDVYREKKHWNKSIKYLQEAIDIYRDQLGEKNGELALTQNTLALTYLEAKNYTQALEEYQKSLLSNLPNTSSAYPVEEIPPLENSFDPLAFCEALQGKAYTFHQFYLQSNNSNFLELAYKHYLECDRLITLLRRKSTRTEDEITFDEMAYQIYQDAIEVTYALYKQRKTDVYIEQGFYFSERSKTQALLTSTSKSNAFDKYFFHKSKRIRDSISVIKEKLAFKYRDADLISEEGLEEKLFTLNQNHELLIDSIKAQYPAHYELRYNDIAISSKVVQEQLLNQHQQLLEYFIGEKKIHLFLISTTHISWHTIDKPENLETTIETYLHALHDNQILELTGQAIPPSQKMKADSSYAHMGHLLYNLLLAPALKKDLPLQLIIVPDGILANIPFEALLTAFPTKIGVYSHYPFLLHQHQISYTYSAALLQQLKNKKSSASIKQELLAFAPQFPDCPIEGDVHNAQFLRSNYFGPIQNEAEVSELQQIVGGKVILGEEATLVNFIKQSPHYAFIHIASHGKANDQNPDLSLIGFSSGKAIDCIFDTLSAIRIANLSLPAEMVVLSACEGATGQLKNGVGIQSLAMAFTYAGAKSLCTTLWSVQDRAMLDMMTSFYQHLNNGSSKDAALRNAKLDYLSEHDNELSHPFYWAAPVVIGDVSTVSFSNSKEIIPLWCYGFLMLFLLFIAFLFFRNR